MPAQTTGRRFFFLLLAAATALMVMVVRPLATALFLATVCAIVIWPVYQWLIARLWKRPSIAAAVAVLGVVVLILAPLGAFSAYLVNEASHGLTFVSSQIRSEGVEGLIHKLPGPLEKLAMQVLSHIPAEWKDVEVDAEMLERVGASGGKAVAVVGAVASATGTVLFQAAMMLIALYFLLLHGEALVAWLDGVLPLPKGQTRELLTEFKSVTFAVVTSTIVTAGVQTLAALIAYFIARVPYMLFFASLTFFAALIPAVGAASVCLVAALVLYATGHPNMAIFLAIWGVTVVGLSDNLVKPLLIKSGMNMSGALVFFALIGGLSAFGTVGLIIGPLVIALFLALLRIYQRDYKVPAPAEATVERPKAAATRSR